MRISNLPNISDKLTSPFRNQRVNVHESHQELVWLMKSGFLAGIKIKILIGSKIFQPIADDHQSAEQSLVGEPSFASLHQSGVYIGVKNALELLLLLPVLAQQVSLLGGVGLRLNLLHGLLEEGVHGLLVFGSKVEVRLESRSSLQPSLTMEMIIFSKNLIPILEPLLTDWAPPRWPPERISPVVCFRRLSCSLTDYTSLCCFPNII